MKRTEVVGVLDGRAVTATWDVTPAPGSVVLDLGHGVTVVLRDPPRTEKTAWIAPYAVNCAAHGWIVSRRTPEACTVEGHTHMARAHTLDVH